MRRLMSVGFGMTVLLASAIASAAPSGGGTSTKGETGGKGGNGPGNESQAGTQEEATGVDSSLVPLGLSRTGQNADQTAVKVEKEKAWEIGATFETHHLLEQQYVGNEDSKTFNVLFGSFRYSLTDSDSLSLSSGLQQVFYADPGEPGVRLFDLNLAYSHSFRLPEKFRLTTTASLSAPIGYFAQLASTITDPSVSVNLSRRFGDLFVSASVRGTYFWDRYSTQAAVGCNTSNNGSSQCDVGSGAANAKWSTGGSLSAEYDMPFHRPLSVGASVIDSYTWFYDVGSAPYKTAFYGATNYGTFDNNPWQQSYGWEAFVRYLLPDLSGFHSEIQVALADGGSGIGNPSVLQDGIVHTYFLSYESAQVYASLSGRY